MRLGVRLVLGYPCVALRYHNCFCAKTRYGYRTKIPGDVTTTCDFTPGAVSGIRLCCNGKCYDSTGYAEHSPPPPPPLAVILGLSPAPPPPGQSPPAAANTCGNTGVTLTTRDCSCEKCLGDSNCFLKDIDGDGATTCEDCAYQCGYGFFEGGFCDCCWQVPLHPPSAFFLTPYFKSCRRPPAA